jgi:hypothetical protein
MNLNPKVKKLELIHPSLRIDIDKEDNVSFFCEVKRPYCEGCKWEGYCHNLRYEVERVVKALRRDVGR